MKNRLEKMNAVNSGGGDFIGSLLWFSVSELNVTKDVLADSFKAAGLDPNYLPKDISPRDAFRRATKGLELKKERNGNPDQHINILVREVAVEPERLVRQVVREVVDSHNKRLGYKVIAQLSLEGLLQPILDVQWMNDVTTDEQNHIRTVREQFDLATENYNGKNVRDILHNILYHCNPVSMRQKGGVYFVPQRHCGTIEGLKAFINDMDQYNVNPQSITEMVSIPVIDTVEQRETVHKNLERQVLSEAAGIMREIQEVMESGKTITAKLASGYMERVKKMSDGVKEYEADLEMKTTKAQAQLKMVKQQASKLIDMITV